LCVCVLFFSHTSKAKTQNFFSLLGVGGNIICKRDRWWVYCLLIVYTLLLPWQFFTLIYMFFFKFEIWNYLFIYLTNIGSTCQDITIYDIIIRCKNNSLPLALSLEKTIWKAF
jgi:hypothetical protein